MQFHNQQPRGMMPSVRRFAVKKGLAMRVSLVSVLLGSAVLGSASTFTVTNPNNLGAGSLRQSLLDVNANEGPDRIEFNLPGAGPHIIVLGSALPIITGPV